MQGYQAGRAVRHFMLWLGRRCAKKTVSGFVGVVVRVCAG